MTESIHIPRFCVKWEVPLIQVFLPFPRLLANPPDRGAMADRIEPEAEHDKSKSEEDLVKRVEELEPQDGSPGGERRVRFQEDLPKKQQKQQQWLMKRGGIEVLDEIGEGSYGKVFLGKWLSSKVALKQFYTKENSAKSDIWASSVSSSWGHTIPSATNKTAVVLPEPEMRRYFEREARVWFRLSYHPHIVRLFGACDEELPLMFVSEYAEHESLDKYLAKHPDELWQKMYELGLGVQYLHERGIVHGDLKLNNIVVGSDRKAKVTDFGLSIVARQQGVGNQMQISGAFHWLAPECMGADDERELPTTMSDVYSLGMCIVEGLKIAHKEVNRCPWGDRDSITVKVFVKNRGQFPYLPTNSCTSTQLTLMKKMCCRTPSDRISIGAVVYALESFADNPLFVIEQNPDEVKSSFEWEYARKQLDKLQSQVEDSDASPTRRAVIECIDAFVNSFGSNALPTRLIMQLNELLYDLQQAKDSDFQQYRVLSLATRDALGSSLRAMTRRLSNIWSIAAAFYGVTGILMSPPQRITQDQIDLLISDNLSSWMLPTELESDEERDGLLQFLRSELENNASAYSPSQASLLEQICDALSSASEFDALQSKPRWFIPWYELQIDQDVLLNEYGAVRVYPARWFDVAVSVRMLLVFGRRRKDGVVTVEDEADLFDIDFSDEESDHQGLLLEQTPISPDTVVTTLDLFNHEAEVWFNLNHPHVVRLFGACNIGNPIFVTEYTNGSLNDFLQHNPNQLWSKLLEVALGVEYLHAVGVVHGDLQCRNVEIGTDHTAKLTDFRLRELSEGINSDITPSALRWMAPECVSGQHATFMSDIYSLGMTIVEAMAIAAASTPSTTEDTKGSQLWLPLRRGSLLLARPPTATDIEWALVTDMCAHKISNRLTATKVVQRIKAICKQQPSCDSLLSSPDSVCL